LLTTTIVGQNAVDPGNTSALVICGLAKSVASARQIVARKSRTLRNQGPRSVSRTLAGCPRSRRFDQNPPRDSSAGSVPSTKIRWVLRWNSKSSRPAISLTAMFSPPVASMMAPSMPTSPKLVDQYGPSLHSMAFDQSDFEWRLVFPTPRNPVIKFVGMRGRSVHGADSFRPTFYEVACSGCSRSPSRAFDQRTAWRYRRFSGVPGDSREPHTTCILSAQGLGRKGIPTPMAGRYS